MKKTLFVGGSRHGEVVEVDDRSPKIDLFVRIKPMPKKESYFFESFMFGFKLMTVALHSSLKKGEPMASTRLGEAILIGLGIESGGQ